MRTFLVLICSLALACAAYGAQEEDKSKKPAPKKKQAQTVQQGATSVGHQPGGGPQKTKGSQQVNTAGAGAQKTKKTKGSQDLTTAGGHPAGAGAQKTKEKTKGSQQIATQGGQAGAGGPGSQRTKKSKGSATNAAAVQAKGKPFKPQKFNLPNKPKPEIAAVKFQQNRRLEGSQNWQGSNYTVFRNYSSQWHDRNWWGSNYNRVVLISGGWYAWNAGFWYPAWGYDPGNSYYPYDGPIYGYNHLPPDQVIANVQSALRQQGYYQGEVDGLLGPVTREAIAGYQRDHGLYTTAAIDEPTLESLGMV